MQALDGSFEMPSSELLLEHGEIHVIRFVRSNLKFSVFGLSFPMPDNAKYEYVKGVILVKEDRLLIFKDRELLTEFPFRLI